jgi:hypothetical protein
MKNNPQQNEDNNAKDQFSNSQQMTFSQQTEFLKTMSNNKQSIDKQLFKTNLLILIK